MRTIIILFSILLVVAARIPKFGKYHRNHVGEYGDRINKARTEVCADDVMYTFHHQYPETTDYLVQFQLRRTFLVNSYNHCKELPRDKQAKCISDWQVSVSEYWNHSGDEIMELFPLIGEQALEQLLEDSLKCYRKFITP